MTWGLGSARSGNYTAWVMVDEVGDVETLGKSLSEKPSEGMYLVRRKYYYLRGCPDFHRMREIY